MSTDSKLRAEIEAGLRAAEEKADDPSAPGYQTRKKVDELKNQGNALFIGGQCGQWQDAIKTYSEAISLDGENTVCYCNRAACYLSLKKTTGALSDATKVHRVLEYLLFHLADASYRLLPWTLIIVKHGRVALLHMMQVS